MVYIQKKDNKVQSIQTELIWTFQGVQNAYCSNHEAEQAVGMPSLMAVDGA